MIFEDDIDKLSGLTPEQKFYKIELLARRRLEESRINSSINEPLLYNEYDYATAVVAAADAYGIEELAKFELPWPSNENSEAQCRMFRAQATRVSNRLMFGEDIKLHSVALDAATKQKLSHMLKQMREAVQKAEITDDKKDRLFALIDKLQAEIDRQRTPVQAAGELWLTVCTYAGQGATRLEPILRGIEKVCTALGLAKEKEPASPRLPAPREPKRIEPPTKKSKGFEDLDDEIPF